MQCSACSVTITLLPDFLVPGFRYVAEVIQQALTGYLTTDASCRDLAIKIAGGVLQDMDSVTDALLFVQLKPSYQRIHAWVKHFAERAASLAQDLTTWLLRLRPDSHLMHLLATPLPTFDTKSGNEVKRRELQTAALLHAMLHRTPELVESRKSPWLAHLGSMAPGFLHRTSALRPPRSRADPPST